MHAHSYLLAISDCTINDSPAKEMSLPCGVQVNSSHPKIKSMQLWFDLNMVSLYELSKFTSTIISNFRYRVKVHLNEHPPWSDLGVANQSALVEC